MKPNLRWQILLASVCLALILALLSFQVQTASLCSETVPADGGTIVEGMVGRPASLNPLFSDANPVDQEIVSLLFDGLTRYDTAGQLVPALAESWAVDESGQTVRFRLREDAVWHDGTPVTAADAAFTYGLLQNEAVPAPAGLRVLWQAVTITVEDSHTIAFTLNTPYAPFLAATTRGLLPAHLLEGVDPAALATHPFNQAPVGTGPFIVENDSWTRTGRLHLRPNPADWPQGTRVDGVELRFFPDYDELAAAFRGGEILAVHQLDPAALPELAALPEMRLFTTTRPRFTQLIFNVFSDTSPVRDLDTRRGLAYGLDRPALIDQALQGQGLVFEGPYLPHSSGYDPSLTSYAYNALTATDHLVEAGWTYNTATAQYENEAGAALAPRLLFPDTAEMAAVATVMAEQWQAISVTVQLVPAAPPDYQAALAAREFDLALLSIAPTGDPDLYDFWSQEAILNGQNYGGWNNRRASEALEAARQEWDPALRLAEYARFLRLFDAELPALTLYQPVESYGISSAVNGVRIGRIDTTRDRYETLADWFFLFRDVTVLCPAPE